MKIDMSTEDALARLEQMMLVRHFEDKAAELYGLQKIRGFLHLYIGEEAVAVGSINGLSADDNIVATYREHGHAIVRGVSPGAVMAEMYGKANGCCRGRGGSMHLFCAEKRFFGGHAIVGGGLPIAVGLALADKMQGVSRTTACFFGDGATDEGEFHEALNLSALWKLPVLFLCENNLYAMGTAIRYHESDVELRHKPTAYGIEADVVDGMDIVAVERAVRYMADVVRNGGGPRFVELKTYRYRAHSMYDAEKYRSKQEVEQWKQRDPIDAFTRCLREASMLDDKELATIEARVSKQVEQAVAFAESSSWEPVDDLEKDVYTAQEAL